jgi:hypothetical protein
VSKIFAELGDFLTGLILNHDAIAGRAWIAAGAAVAMGDQVVLGRIFARGIFTLRKQRLGCGAAGVRHGNKFTTSVGFVAAGGNSFGT